MGLGCSSSNSVSATSYGSRPYNLSGTQFPCLENGGDDTSVLLKELLGRLNELNHVKGLKRASQVAQWVKNLPATQETQRHRFDPWVRKIPPEKGMATHSSTLA